MLNRFQFQYLAARSLRNQDRARGLKMATNSSSFVYQFRITLEESDPPIWRRIQVPGNFNFRQLHLAIQEAMGWESSEFDYHLHQFEMVHPRTSKKVSIGIPDEDGFSDSHVLSEKRVKIGNYFTLSNNKANYEYDFGDGWEHEILLEDILLAVVNERYPICVAGERACPPEDCGGIYCYENLRTRSNRNTPQHDHFDPRLVELWQHHLKLTNDNVS